LSKPTSIDDAALRALGRAHLARLLGRALRATQAAAMTGMAARGHGAVRPADVAVFTNIDAAGTRISELARRAGMSTQGMAKLVRSLEAAGYVATGRDPRDARATVVQLTAEGVRFCDDAQVVMDALWDALDERLGGGRIGELRASLEELSQLPVDALLDGADA
jgi:DNA-binding MarR family transcriptional regulator